MANIDLHIPHSLSNPYSPGPMVTDKNMFFGRENELLTISTNLENLGSNSIVGMRRFGKSSLLFHITHHYQFSLSKKLLLAYLDLQDANFHTLQGLLTGAVKQWYSKLGRPPVSLNGLTQFSEIVKDLSSQGVHPVLCLDEFENLIKRPQEFNDSMFEGWRALSNARTLAFVTASQSPLVELIRQSGLSSNFDNIFIQIDLGLLSDKSAKSLITKPMVNLGIRISDDAIKEILNLGGRHPFFLQMAASIYFNISQTIAEDFIKIREEFEWQSEHHFRGLWQALSLQEQSAIRGSLGIALSSLEAESHRRRLARIGVLYKDGDSYKPFSYAFGKWIEKEPLQNIVITTPEKREIVNTNSDSIPIKPTNRLGPNVNLWSYALELIRKLPCLPRCWWRPRERKRASYLTSHTNGCGCSAFLPANQAYVQRPNAWPGTGFHPGSGKGLAVRLCVCDV